MTDIVVKRGDETIAVALGGAQGPLGIVFDTPPVPGRFLAKAPGADNRKFVDLTGATPANAVALTDLASTNGSSLVGFRGAGSGSVASDMQTKGREIVSVSDFGSAAEIGSDSTAAIARAAAATGGTAFLIGGSLSLPKGQYPTKGGTLSTSQFWRLHGDGQLSSFFVNSGLTTESFFTTSVSFGFVGYDDFGVRGYKSFLNCTGNVEQLFSRNLHVFNGSGNAFDIAGFLITGQFDGLHIDGQNHAGSGGFKVGGSFNNLLFNTPQFNNLAEAAFDLQFSEGVATVNARAEGGDAPSKSFMKLANGTHQQLTHINAYLEGEYEYVISADGAGATPYNGPGVISFIGSHFTHWHEGVPHKWAITSPFVMMANDFHIATRVPPTAQVLGYNHNLIRCEYVSTTPFVSKRRRPATVAGTGPWTQDLVAFNRPSAENSPINVTVLTGRLVYNASWSNPDGGASGSVAREYQVIVRGRAGGNLTIAVTLIGTAMDDGNGSSVLAIQASGAPSPAGVSVIATWTGVNPTVIQNFDQQFSFTWNQSAGVAANTFAISEPGA